MIETGIIGETQSARFKEAQRQMHENDPPIEVNQRWIVRVNGKVFRRLRILAPHPDGGWIYVDEPTNLHIGVCPEFNLRYVFQLEKPK